MASPQPIITLASLTTSPEVTSNTISLYLQLTFGAGYYTVGGIASGISAFVSDLTIDASQFLQSIVGGEDPVTASPLVGGVQYKYNPSNDTIQLFTAAGVEFTASELIPASVLNDIVVGKFTFNRL